jgi:hypothetical protein
MRKAGADRNEVTAVSWLLEIANIANVGDTGASHRAAIESVLKIQERLGGGGFGD